MQRLVYAAPQSSIGGTFNGGRKPAGVILHGSRSGRDQSISQEFYGTANFAKAGANGLGWNVTIGNSMYAFHIAPTQWGWNARAASSKYLAVEFAQPTADVDITDEQVDAFCAWWRNDVRWLYQGLTLTTANMPTHAELQEGIADGKSDCYPLGDPRADDLRQRILEAL